VVFCVWESKEAATILLPQTIGAIFMLLGWRACGVVKRLRGNSERLADGKTLYAPVSQLGVDGGNAHNQMALQNGGGDAARPRSQRFASDSRFRASMRFRHASASAPDLQAPLRTVSPTIRPQTQKSVRSSGQAPHAMASPITQGKAHRRRSSGGK